MIFDFPKCDKDNSDKFDFFMMFDIYEFLFKVDDIITYDLTNKRSNKYDFRKNYLLPRYNKLIYYASKSLLDRFRPLYINSEIVKQIIRYIISDL